MKYYVIAGEASGDLHASNLIRELKKLDQNSEFRVWGGDKMEAQGALVVKHYRDLAFMGFTEVLQNLRTILNNISFCKKDVQEYKPDALILVDYPGFNLRIAEFAKKQNIPVLYYISPQIWAWKQSRVHKIKRDVDRMFTILPFEKEFYARFGCDVDFVGHPLLDVISEGSARTIKTSQILKNDKSAVIALLPGSRKQEIRAMLPSMLQVATEFPRFRFVLAAAPSIEPAFYDEICKGRNVEIHYGKTYELLSESYAALVTSGTATLETALFGVPQVVCYKGGSISYAIARSLVKVKYISLVNLIMDREVVKELIQNEFNVSSLKSELERILNPMIREKMSSDYEQLRKKLGGSGASARAAKLMMDTLGRIRNHHS
ncbi:MAG: lipid-A-disaccharide synthase [Bacteroidetes bacterium]|nr:MAG: lipid-A-disaccharide synthase [Bacteroidota bacterium]REK07055.1 MAG: lipid-A-disaccharide synthase [Bacteroidota bacterium]REK33599.1 MAG: lipid-A-disaccharide synthase [Bacteroidota bacterium]REK48583.1 MAG: lipid-A-disaccharide synthase [Bacteroidota bacterium]